MSVVPFLDAETPDLRRWFEVPTLEAWQAEATRLLKGRPLASLTRRLPDGLALAPLHVAGGLGAPVPPGEGGRWWLTSTVDAGTASDVAAALAGDLALGAGVRLVPDDRGADAPGIALPDGAALADVLRAAGAAVADVVLVAGAQPVRWAARRSEAVALLGVDEGPVLVVDPLAELLAGHADGAAVDAAFAALPELLADGAEVEVSTLDLPGIDAVTELAVLLAAVAETVRRLSDVDPDLLHDLRVRVVAGRDTFVEVAKLRAGRLLVDRLLDRAGLAPWVRWEVVAAPSSLTRHDPWTNLLRGAHAALIGALGGAAAVEVAPWDRALGVPDAVARRAALTSQLVLIEETDLFGEGRVDAAAGSYLVEQLTVDLARAAWEAFRALERDGGLVAAHASGALAARVDAARAAADTAIGRRDRGIVGVSLFANPDEVLPARAAAAPPSSWREAAGWEELRDGASASGVRAFLANLGSPDRHAARRGFVRSLLEAAGIGSVDGPPGLDAAALVAAFRASAADGVVVCGDDADYVDLVGPLAAGLRDAGARFVLLAGRPGEREDAWRDAGLTGAVFVGGDVLATLVAAVQGVTR